MTSTAAQAGCPAGRTAGGPAGCRGAGTAPGLVAGTPPGRGAGTPPGPVPPGTGWGGGFYWRGGGAQVSAAQTNYSSPLINSPYFGWQLVCGASTCDGSTKPGEIAVLELEIAGAESSGPTVSVAPGS